ncbi:putative dehydrogenase [Halanaerobium saccharolyticum]|jgi:predicted dehydrogenase|uniref:Putative dehydrogenase n=1 Tax=Halanaerobium saccharolyticum TaxID=43595 RepID=A0A4V3G4B8_9FIRM|nr:Gfo/Idh/MocA family oxidoreductase [Halanaerobium saccharolyticum]RAK05462.1 putative dehydrogenase [Halanaerobium saccharolyticum]TDV99797.1 putative dehydrogenase [Halanaerobium saccharolyticum]TDX52019.1 putative dehydrogenase [Halanaerobium saccharolyticum]
MKKLKAAIIGCGNIYPVHADILASKENVELKHMIDIKENRAQKAAEKYNCEYLTDYSKLLDKELDVVHICTPHFLHSPMAIKFLESEINVLVEKPLALNYAEGRKLIQAAEKSRAHLGVAFQNRFNENNQRAKKILEAETLGKITGIKGLVTWHRDRDYYLNDEWKGFYKTEGGGVLINQAIHTLDLIQWFGGPVKAARGNVDTRVLDDVIEVEDTADATLFFEADFNGIFYATNAFSSNSPIEIEIDCEKGSMRLFEDQLLIKKDGQIDNFKENSDTDYKAYWGYGHQRLIDGFYQDIWNDTQSNTINAQEGIKTLELIKAINTSSKNRSKYYLTGDDSA